MGLAGVRVPNLRRPMFGSGFAIEMSTAAALEAVAVKACLAPIDSGSASG